MRSTLHLFACFLFLVSCQDDNTSAPLEQDLKTYMEANNTLELADLIACAGGNINGLFNIPEIPTSIFFYPIDGASEFKYFEAQNIADSLDFSKYTLMELDMDPIFNGYLMKFNRTTFKGERVGIVSYKTPGKLHVCSPIRLKTNTKPTEVNPALVEIMASGTQPTFTWTDGSINENVIYFQIISALNQNLISGTYTYEKNFTFYDLSNVVLNITDSIPEPMLEANTEYKFTMMAVSEDNWVNLLIEQPFSTN